MPRRLLQGLAIAAAALAVAAVPATAEAQCAAGYTFTAWAGGSSCYQVIAAPLTWNAANDQAVTLNGWLATLNSSAENTAARSFVNSTLVGNSSVWIGLNDLASEGAFVWANGESTNGFFAWNGGEPNNVGNEDAVELLSNGAWNDLPHNSPGAVRFALVESAATTVPEPATVGLLGAGLAVLGVAARRRRAPA